MGRLRDIHWESHLVHMADLREDPPMGFHVEKFRVQHWESHLEPM